MPDLATDYLALRREAGAFLVPRAFVAVVGPDAVRFLHSQVSQDVERLAVGDAAWTLLLEPDGKLTAIMRVHKISAEELVLELDEAAAERAVTRLRRFKLRTKADFEDRTWTCWSVRGPQAHDRATGIVDDWPGLPGVDVVGPDAAAPAGVPVVGRDAWEAVRVEAGWPSSAGELAQPVIPAEVPLLVERAVSFTKGCYTGQELVERVDSRGGNAPRKLRGVVVGANVLPPVGAEVVVADGAKVVGALSTVAESLDRRAPVALAFVHRSVEPPADVVLRWPGLAGDGVPARVEALPLV